MTGMDGKAVTLMIRFKDHEDGKWKRRPAARGANGRVKPGHALIDGKTIAVHQGAYELRQIVDRQPVYIPAGNKAAVADAKRQQLEIKSSVKAQAEEAGLEVVEVPESNTLRAVFAAYIDNKLKSGFTEAAEQARLVSGEFLRLVKCARIDEVTQEDFFRYHQWLRRNQCGDRTVANKHTRLASILRTGGINPKQVPPRPRYEEKLPDMYSSEQTRALLSAANPEMRVLILIALKCGLREQELMHVEFRDIDWENKTLRVRAKPQWAFMVKTWEQREVPVPDDVLSALKKWQKKRANQSLILGTERGKPNTHMLRSLKRLAHRANLNCNRCDSCVASNECEEYTLHRFRRTYITTMLRGLNGDIATVQRYAGHKDLGSTMRYLSPQSAPEAQAKVNAIKW
jgi:integrase